MKNVFAYYSSETWGEQAGFLFLIPKPQKRYIFGVEYMMVSPEIMPSKSTFIYIIINYKLDMYSMIVFAMVK